MHKYIVKRVLMLVPILLALTFIVFSIISITPGNPGRIILGPKASQEAVERLNNELGYNKPFLVRYVNYISSAISGDFGNSYSTGRPVVEEILSRLPTTVILAVLAIISSVMIGVPLGILSAVKQYSTIDILSTIAAMLMASVPGFWLGLMIIILFSLKLGWLPSNGIGSFAHFIMPTIVLGVASAGFYLRMTRTTMLETIRQDYIRTARAKGATERSVIWEHALKNALLPLITVIGMDFGGLLGGTVITEVIFSMPGLGTLTLTAIRMKDIPLAMATIIFLAAIYCIIMMMVDILYAFIDPRVKALYIKDTVKCRWKPAANSEGAKI